MNLNGKKSPKMNPEEEKLKGIGWDHAIDVTVKQLMRQIEGLRQAQKDKPELAPIVKTSVDICANLIEQLKKAKGHPEQQQFSVEEVREIVDNVTGEVLMANKSIMEYYDAYWMPKYMAGHMELKKFTEKKESKYDTGEDN